MSKETADLKKSLEDNSQKKSDKDKKTAKPVKAKTPSANVLKKKALKEKARKLLSAIFPFNDEKAIAEYLDAETATFDENNGNIRLYPNNSPLCAAICAKNLDLVQRIIKLGGKVTTFAFIKTIEKIKSYNYGKEIRFDKESDELFKFILQHFKDYNFSYDGKSALACLLSNHVSTEWINYFLSKGAQIETDALIECLKPLNRDLFDDFLNTYLSKNNYTTASSSSSSAAAAGVNKNHKAVLETLYQILINCFSFAIPNVRNSDSSLIRSPKTTHFLNETVKKVLALGIDPNYYMSGTLIFEQLGPCQVTAPLIFYAAHSYNFELVNILISTMPNVNVNLKCNVTNITPLMVALLRGHSETTKLLLKHKADVMVESLPVVVGTLSHYRYEVPVLDLIAGDKLTALQCAITKLRLLDSDIIPLLCAAGANINEVYHNEESCIYYVLRSNNHAIIKRLLDLPNLNLNTTVSTDQTWNSPLCEAVKLQNLNYVKQCYRDSLHENAKQKALMIALHYYLNSWHNSDKSSEETKLNILYYLFQNPVSKTWSIKDKHPLETVDFQKCSQEKFEIIKRLMTSGLCVNVQSAMNILNYAVGLKDLGFFKCVLDNMLACNNPLTEKDKIIQALNLTLFKICLQPLPRVELNRKIQGEFLMQAATSLLKNGADPNFVILAQYTFDENSGKHDCILNKVIRCDPLNFNEIRDLKTAR